MKPIPQAVLHGFNQLMSEREIASLFRPHYRKWLLYFLDFRIKYRLPDVPDDQVRLFSEKLRSKNQSQGQVEQAKDAVSLFFSLPDAASPHTPGSPSASGPVERMGGSVAAESRTALQFKTAGMVCEPPGVYDPPGSRLTGKRYDEWRCLRKTASAPWDQAVEKLAAEIKVRHYSRKTLKHYADWTRKFQQFLKDKQPSDLSASDVKAYLTYLAVDCRVSSSHQNLAFNALLFLFRHVLKKDFGDQSDISPRQDLKLRSYGPFTKGNRYCIAVPQSSFQTCCPAPIWVRFAHIRSLQNYRQACPGVAR